MVNNQDVHNDKLLLTFKHTRNLNILYLNNCSTVMTTKNKNYLSNVCEVDEELSVSCNTREAMTAQVGMLGGIDCWYMPDDIANIC